MKAIENFHSELVRVLKEHPVDYIKQNLTLTTTPKSKTIGVESHTRVIWKKSRLDHQRDLEHFMRTNTEVFTYPEAQIQRAIQEQLEVEKKLDTLSKALSAYIKVQYETHWDSEGAQRGLADRSLLGGNTLIIKNSWYPNFCPSLIEYCSSCLWVGAWESWEHSEIAKTTPPPLIEPSLNSSSKPDLRI